jgi:hypothetical protein
MDREDIAFLNQLVHQRMEANRLALDEALADIPPEVQERVKSIKAENRRLIALAMELNRQLTPSSLETDLVRMGVEVLLGDER